MYIIIRKCLGRIIMFFFNSFFSFVFRKFPLTNKVVFSNFNGKGYGDDPKYIANALHEMSPNTIIVWLVNTETKMIGFPSFVKCVKNGSLKSLYHMCTARCWCANSRGSFIVKKRKMQFYIQTWHCTLGLKDSEAATPTLPLVWRRAAESDAQKVDLMYSDNDIMVNYYRNYFYQPASVIKCDVPRVGFMKNNINILRDKVKNHYNIGDNKIILYAPTFRKNKNIELYKFDFQKTINVASEAFGSRFVLLIRLHPFFSSMANEISYGPNVVDASTYPDMQELICASDILITDFSSCMFDACLLKKPVFLYAKDFKTYTREERGMIFRFQDLPFTISESIEVLCNNMKCFSYDEYDQNSESFLSSIGFKDNGQGDYFIANILDSHLNVQYYV